MKKLIEDLVSLGVEVTIYKNRERGIVYNVNTRTKSQLLLSEEKDGTWTGYARYDTVHKGIETAEDLAIIVKDCMHGRDYIDSAWHEILVNYDLL